MSGTSSAIAGRRRLLAGLFALAFAGVVAGSVAPMAGSNETHNGTPVVMGPDNIVKK